MDRPNFSQNPLLSQFLWLVLLTLSASHRHDRSPFLTYRLSNRLYPHSPWHSLRLGRGNRGRYSPAQIPFCRTCLDDDRDSGSNTNTSDHRKGFGLLALPVLPCSIFIQILVNRRGLSRQRELIGSFPSVGYGILDFLIRTQSLDLCCMESFCRVDIKSSCYVKHVARYALTRRETWQTQVVLNVPAPTNHAH